MKLPQNLSRPNRLAAFTLAAILVAGLGLRAWNLCKQGLWASDGILYYELARGLLEDGKVLSGKAVRTIITSGNLEFYDNLFLQGKYGHILLILVAFLFTGVKAEAVLLLNLALGTAAIGLIYRLGKIIFDQTSALAASALAAFSLIFINYSRTALTPSGSMFFFTLGLVFFFRNLREGRGTNFIHPLFWSGLSVGYAFTIHYNLAYYFLLVYFSHLFLSLSAGQRRNQWIKDNLVFACGLSLPLMAFEFGYPLLYYVIFKKHVLYTYFQEVLYNALEAGGGSSLWNYFVLYLSLAESPAFCALVFLAGIWTLAAMNRDRDTVKGLVVLFAFFPPILLSALNFPLVGRNLAPSLPLFAVMAGGLIAWLSGNFFPRHKEWACAGMVLALTGFGLPHLSESYNVSSPMIEARLDLKGKSVAMIARDELYREAILYGISETVSVVPSVSSLKKDSTSRKYFLLARPKTLDCAPVKTYRAYNKSRFRPIRYEDNIPEPENHASYYDRFSVYDLSGCLQPVNASANSRSIMEIGRGYSVRKARRTSPARIHFAAGIDYLKADYLDEAIYEFEQTVHENPNMPQARNNLAFALIQQKRQNEALPHLEIAEKLSAGMLETQNLFGLAHLFNGDVDKAIQYFELASRIDPKHPTAYQYLYQIHSKIKQDPEKARTYADKLRKTEGK